MRGFLGLRSAHLKNDDLATFHKKVSIKCARIGRVNLNRQYFNMALPLSQKLWLYDFNDSGDFLLCLITASRILGYAVAVYDYAANATSQLSLCRGDRVAILSKTGSDKGWWKGEHCATGKVRVILYCPYSVLNDFFFFLILITVRKHNCYFYISG